MSVAFEYWVGFFALVLVLLALDLGIFNRRVKEITVKNALWMSLFYFLLAIIFSVFVFRQFGHQAGYDFLTAYLVEKSLSVDNLFVFLLVFTHFQVPKNLQHRVLYWGILGALLMRGMIIMVGVELIHNFSWILYLFGVFLIYTGIKMLFSAGSEPDLENNKIVGTLNRRFHVTRDYRGKAFFLRENGKLWITPLLVVLIMIEITDLVFALDSIPAVFAVTQEPFVIYTSNVFAILGLRALYFALAGMMHRFEYLKYGLSAVLVIIGGKMLLNEFYGKKVIGTDVALLITATIIIGSMLFSLYKTRHQKAPKKLTDIAPYMTGWIPGSDETKQD